MSWSKALARTRTGQEHRRGEASQVASVPSSRVTVRSGPGSRLSRVLQEHPGFWKGPHLPLPNVLLMAWRSWNERQAKWAKGHLAPANPQPDAPLREPVLSVFLSSASVHLGSRLAQPWAEAEGVGAERGMPRTRPGLRGGSRVPGRRAASASGPDLRTPWTWAGHAGVPRGIPLPTCDSYFLSQGQRGDRERLLLPAGARGPCQQPSSGFP